MSTSSVETIVQASEPLIVVSKRHWTRKWRITVILLVVVVLAIVAWFVFIRSAIEKRREPAAYHLANSITINALNRSNNSKVISTDTGFLNKYAAFANKQQLYTIDNNLTIAYINNNDFNSALKWQLSAISNASPASYNNYSNLASIYDKLGNKTAALKYYKLSLSKLQSDPQAEVTSDNQGAIIGQQISQLEKSN